MSSPRLKELVADLENAATFSAGNNAVILSNAAWQRLKIVINALAEEVDAKTVVVVPHPVPSPSGEITRNHKSQLPSIKNMKAAIRWWKREQAPDASNEGRRPPPPGILKWVQDQDARDLLGLEAHLNAIGDNGTIVWEDWRHLRPYRGPAPDYMPLY